MGNVWRLFVIPEVKPTVFFSHLRKLVRKELQLEISHYTCGELRTKQQHTWRVEDAAGCRREGTVRNLQTACARTARELKCAVLTWTNSDGCQGTVELRGPTRDGQELRVWIDYSDFAASCDEMPGAKVSKPAEPYPESFEAIITSLLPFIDNQQYTHILSALRTRMGYRS